MNKTLDIIFDDIVTKEVWKDVNIIFNKYIYNMQFIKRHFLRKSSF